MRIRLTFDDGLAAYIRAQAKVLYGTDKAAIVALVRRSILEDCKSDNLLEWMYPHLPADIQQAWAHRRIER